MVLEMDLFWCWC